MDLHFTADEPTASEVDAVDAVLGAADSRWFGGQRVDPSEAQTSESGHRTAGQRHLLLPVLHAIHGRAGWISRGALNYACKRLEVPPAEAYGVATFYDMFSLEQAPPVVARVCDDIACQAKGASDLCAGLERAMGPAGDGKASRCGWVRSPCLGQCERAPAVLVTAAGERPWTSVIAPATAQAVEAACSEDSPADAPQVRESVPQAGQASLELLHRVGSPSPQSLADYRADGGLRAWELALEQGPEWVIEQVERSNLVGRGGAAFPTGRKWRAVAQAGSPKYVVCNADESEPGTFKDRVLMEGDPFGVVEAIMIAAFATGSERAYVYVRGEYPDATERMRSAISEMGSAGLLERACPIEIRRGAGAYICGEETALFNSIEGFRGEPRNKPPYPTESGLFGRPTLVNNVETLANVLRILPQGGAAYAAVGTERSSGPKLFCLSGHVAKPGVYEVPFGATVRELIELAGGVSGTGRLQAVLVGGAAGAFLGPDELDAPFTFEGMRAVGATVGSAVVMPFDDSVDLGAVLLRIAEFFRDESCGQCVPCRVGTVRQEELLERLRSGQTIGTLDHERQLLREVSQVMRDASICGLGHTAASAVDSALERFPIFQGATR
ncbi:MAG: NAD(P)H-dependent oxidoreductase subunit E [Bryobacterales bacterium]|nr:NAD(P)H-dependent oxidoreductase subunit E [Bryobacterales bacterium]MDE0263415.1 NAD(P)H-dependent oxidoreductase subunit E [Bryobacterales bacterium]MDE0623255.1 NAD(P)H-dependent oxidoreductase subunit E [Bryobacterales bacterium]